jgi:hypothetical protein
VVKTGTILRLLLQQQLANTRPLCAESAACGGHGCGGIAACAALSLAKRRMERRSESIQVGACPWAAT